MNWKNWKVGLLVATIIGFFTACGAAAVLNVILDWKFFFFFTSLVGKDIVLYCVQHPADSISFDTTSVKKTAKDGSTVESVNRTTTISAGTQTTAGGKNNNEPVGS